LTASETTALLKKKMGIPAGELVYHFRATNDKSDKVGYLFNQGANVFNRVKKQLGSTLSPSIGGISIHPNSLRHGHHSLQIVLGARVAPAGDNEAAWQAVVVNGDDVTNEIEVRDQYSVQDSDGGPPAGRRVFIGHGGLSTAWRDLKDFLVERLALSWDEFNREATAGIATKERLQTMLDQSQFAFLIMTAEDERADGSKMARANVIHEVGLFQGRLGFEKAIVLLEEGCGEFSNITGIGQIRFRQGDISSSFEEVRRVLEREEIIRRA
jgi:predicted nucleotide-binding protein